MAVSKRWRWGTGNLGGKKGKNKKQKQDSSLLRSRDCSESWMSSWQSSVSVEKMPHEKKKKRKEKLERFRTKGGEVRPVVHSLVLCWWLSSSAGLTAQFRWSEQCINVGSSHKRSTRSKLGLGTKEEEKKKRRRKMKEEGRAGGNDFLSKSEYSAISYCKSSCSNKNPCVAVKKLSCLNMNIVLSFCSF